jgi:NAD/NADP transhydrogenase beta subunit
VIGSLAAGGLVGNQIASRINITDLPQMVAAYHSLVGLAAAVTSIANIMLMAEAGHDMDGVHMVTAFLGDIIGAITLTGSVSGGMYGLNKQWVFCRGVAACCRPSWVTSWRHHADGLGE